EWSRCVNAQRHIPSFAPILILSVLCLFAANPNAAFSLKQHATRNPTIISELRFDSLLLSSRWRREDVLRFPCLEVVVGFNNLSMSVGRNVKSRPLSAGGEPGLPLAKYGHTLNWNVCEPVGCPCVKNFKLIRSRQRQVFFLQIRSKLIQTRRKLALMICQIMFDCLVES